MILYYALRVLSALLYNTFLETLYVGANLI